MSPTTGSVFVAETRREGMVCRVGGVRTDSWGRTLGSFGRALEAEDSLAAGVVVVEEEGGDGVVMTVPAREAWI
jgi:hypothetical protein